MYFLRISFQFFFYLRNDIYYVMATASGARNLMGDTEVFLRNGIARLLRRHDRLADQSSFSRREKSRSVRPTWVRRLPLPSTVFQTVDLFVGAVPGLARSGACLPRGLPVAG